MPAQFYTLAPIEFDQAISDKNKQDENREKFELETMRLQTVILVNTQLEKQHVIKDPRKLIAFPWDDKKGDSDTYIPTPEDWERFDNISKKIWQGKQSTN